VSRRMQASRRRETRRSCLSFRDAPTGRRVAPPDDRLRIANKASGHLAIGDKKEIDKATWGKPRGIRLTPSSRYIRDKLFPKRG
jgi:hypothetical protein